MVRWQLQHGLAPRAFALLETVGRRTGQPRQTCVGNGLMGDTFWAVAAHGQQADCDNFYLYGLRARRLTANSEDGREQSRGKRAAGVTRRSG